ESQSLSLCLEPVELLQSKVTRFPSGTKIPSIPSARHLTHHHKSDPDLSKFSRN
ncbi:hypothetical protein LEMLEM_LOCUS1977, partial [Lemmus lemmus]